MKAAPVLAALARVSGVQQTLIHTGQHYDSNMSDVFLQQLEMPPPDVNLDVGSGSHARQTAEIMSRFEPVVTERRPDFVLVYGECQLHCGRSTGVLQTSGASGTRRSWVALSRPQHARGN